MLLLFTAGAVNVAPKIRQEFATYSEFLSGQKTIGERAIALAELPTRSVRRGDASVTCAVVDGQKRFEVEVSVSNPRNYKLKVFAEWFHEGPCFRFDSQGNAHCNPEDGRGLAARQVLTPHFHRFNDDGVEIAYKSSVLAQERQAAAIVNDSALGVAHFCQEGKLACAGSDYPQLVFDQPELGVVSEDPLDGVRFS